MLLCFSGLVSCSLVASIFFYLSSLRFLDFSFFPFFAFLSLASSVDHPLWTLLMLPLCFLRATLPLSALPSLARAIFLSALGTKRNFFFLSSSVHCYDGRFCVYHLLLIWPIIFS
jgi:hypothetical protein